MIISQMPVGVSEGMPAEPAAMPVADSASPNAPISFLEALAQWCGMSSAAAMKTGPASSSTAPVTGETAEAVTTEDSGEEKSEVSEELLSALAAAVPGLFMCVPLSAMVGSVSNAAPADTAPVEETPTPEGTPASFSPAAGSTRPAGAGSALPNAAAQTPLEAAEWLARFLPPAAAETPELIIEDLVAQKAVNIKQLEALNLVPALEVLPNEVAPKPAGKPVQETQAGASAAPPAMLTKSSALELTPTSSLPAPADTTPKAVDTLQVQAVRNVRYLLDRNGHTVSVRLIPESLGELHIHVQVRGEELTVRFVSSNPLVRDALEDQMAGLRQALTRPGGPTPEVQVAAHAGQSFSAGSDTRQGPGQWGAAARYQATPVASVNAAANPKKISAREERPHDGTLNLLI